VSAIEKGDQMKNALKVYFGLSLLLFVLAFQNCSDKFSFQSVSSDSALSQGVTTAGPGPLPPGSTTPPPTPTGTPIVSTDSDSDQNGNSVHWGCNANESVDLSAVMTVDPSLTSADDFIYTNQSFMAPVEIKKAHDLQLTNSGFSLLKADYAVSAEVTNSKGIGYELHANSVSIQTSMYGGARILAAEVKNFTNIHDGVSEVAAQSIDNLSNVHSLAFCMSAAKFGPVANVHTGVAIFSGRSDSASQAQSFDDIQAGIVRFKNLSIGSITNVHTDHVIIVRSSTVNSIDNGAGALVLVDSHVKSITNFSGTVYLKGSSVVDSTTAQIVKLN
jgi:hypothetical protein